MRLERLFWPGLIAVILGLPIVSVLLQRVPNIRDFEIVNPAAGRSVFVTLGRTTNDRGVSIARKVIWHRAEAGPLAHDQVQLLTVAAPVTLLSGELRVAGTDCVYRTPPRQRLVNGGYLPFKRVAPCEAQAQDWQELELTLAYLGPGQIGLATYFVAPARVDPRWMLLTPPQSDNKHPIPVVRGRYSDDLGGPQPRRIDLLGYVWSSKPPWWIWLVVVVALATIAFGVTLASPALPASLASAAAGVGCTALALGLLYSVLVPPLQAPDEPDHVLAFAQVAGRPQLADSLAALARRGHFDRIHFRPAERFRPIDIAQPSTTTWNNDVFAHTVESRSMTTWMWWKVLAPVAGHRTAAEAILIVRMANALLFAVMMAAAAALLRYTTDSSIATPHLVTWSLLLIPTLPFFATHVSEFAVLASSYVLLAAVITALFLDGDRGHYLGLPLGLGAACILAGGRSGLPFLATIFAVLAGRVLLGSPDARSAGNPVKVLVFWGGLALGLMVFPLLSTPEFRGGLWPADARKVPPWFQSFAELFRRNPWSLGALVPVGFAGEVVMTWCRQRLPRAGNAVHMIVTSGCVAIAAAIAGTLLLSLVIQLPTVPFREMTPVTSVQMYIFDVLKTTTTSFRLAGHDNLLSLSFWGAFGWLETTLPVPVLNIPIASTALAMFALLHHVARSPSTRPAVWLGLFGTGWILTMVLYAMANFFLGRNLHGRYMLGLYIAGMSVAWCGLAWHPQIGAEGAKHSLFLKVRPLWVISLAAVVHGFSLSFILLRYF